MLTTGVASSAGVLASGIAVVVFSAVVEVSDAVSAAGVAVSVVGAGAGASWSANATLPSAKAAKSAADAKVNFLIFIIKPLQKNKIKIEH